MLTFSPTTDAILAALFRLQADVPAVPKTSYSSTTDSWYASLPQVLDTLQPLLKANEILVLPSVTQEAHQVTVATRLVHMPSKEWVETTLIFLTANATPHEVASAITYGRRLGICLICNLRTPDDDAAGAMQGQAPLRQPRSVAGTMAAGMPRGGEAETAASTPVATGSPASTTPASTAASTAAAPSPTTPATPTPVVQAAVSAPLADPPAPPAPLAPPVQAAVSAPPADPPTPSPSGPGIASSARGTFYAALRRYRDLHGKEAAERMLLRSARTTLPACVPEERLQTLTAEVLAALPAA